MVMMKKVIAILLSAVLMAGCTGERKEASIGQEPPHLEKRGGVTQLIVQGQP